MNTTWNSELLTAIAATGDTTLIIASAPLDHHLPSGRLRDDPVLVWTEARVYIPIVDDGGPAYVSAPRNPAPTGQEHVGGW